MASISLPVPRRRALSFGAIGPWLVLLLVGLLVLVPVLLIVVNSFQTSLPGRPTTYSLDAWRRVLAEPTMLDAVWNTVTLTLARQVIAMPIAILIAWLLARTDIPGARWLEFLFWVAYFLPTLPVTLGWIMLLDPQYGLLNEVVKLLPFVDKGPFDIYSFWGIVWAHLGTNTIAIKVMLLTPAFRNMDASLEEASRTSGASTMGTLLRVVVPIMTPVVVVVLLLSIIHALQAFEIELILGAPIRLHVFSTQIYTLIHQEPPLFPEATALSTMILILMLPLIVLQRWATGRRSYRTVGGHFKPHKVRLGAWRIPTLVFVLALALLITVVPAIFLTMGTFMKLFGFFNTPELWTLQHWNRVLADPIFISSVWNTIVLAGGTAIVSVCVFTLVAYIVMRTHFAGRGALDLVSWLPSTLPGIILGLGLLWLVLGTPLLRPIYGTTLVLILATVIASMTTCVQLIKSNFAQLNFDIEEAARVGGGTWLDAFRHVLLPLITPTLLLVGAVSFIAAARNVSTVALLATSSNRPLSLLQVDYMVEGRYESAAVVGLIVVFITTGVALVARLLGLRIGIRE